MLEIRASKVSSLSTISCCFSREGIDILIFDREPPFVKARVVKVADLITSFLKDYVKKQYLQYSGSNLDVLGLARKTKPLNVQFSISSKRTDGNPTSSLVSEVLVKNTSPLRHL